MRSFRLVCAPEKIQLVENFLAAEGYVFEPEPFSPFCRRLLEEPRPLGSSLAAFFGYIYIQDRSSMLPPLALNPPPGSAILDMCASPGSKSGFLAQLAGENGFVLANEPNMARLGTLRANMHQANLLQVGTCCHAGESIPLLPESLDYILLDPPCSGWGTAEKNPRAPQIWKGKKLRTLTELQKALLNHAEKLLKPGGLLLYSTCTTNPDENEQQTLHAEENLGLERVPLKPFAGFVFEERPNGQGCLLVQGEASAAQGFYLSLLRKKGHRPAVASVRNTAIACPGQFLDREGAGCEFHDPDLLPPGDIAIFGNKARFLPAPAREIIPRGFAWQGALLGSAKTGGVYSPAPRLRTILRPDMPALVLENLEEIKKLLSGQSLRCSAASNSISLWWGGLPLGVASIKSGRLICAFR